MTVQDLIEELTKVKDKTKTVVLVDVHKWYGIKVRALDEVYEDYGDSEVALYVNE